MQKSRPTQQFLTACSQAASCTLACWFVLGAFSTTAAFAQTPPHLRKASNARSRPPQVRASQRLSAPVRSASIEIHDPVGVIEPLSDADYEASLAPTATEDFATVGLQPENACNGCGTVGYGCHCQPFGWLLDWSRGELWLGTTSFSGASSFLGTAAGDAGQIAGNFGFQEGFNFGTRLPGVLGGQIGSQLGMRFTQTQLDGTTAGDDNRTQFFVTAGLFRRVDYGLQGGLVVDYLHDDWIYRADLLQLRGEISFLFSPCHDLGFRFSESQQIDETRAFLRGLADPLDISLSALNTYRFFYRYRFGPAAAGTAEVQAGFTEDDAAILGTNLRVPLESQLGLEFNATYLLPPSAADPPYTRESWNLGVSMVFTPGRVFGRDRDYYRPLMDVADNGNFLTRHIP